MTFYFCQLLERQQWPNGLGVDLVSKNIIYSMISICHSVQQLYTLASCMYMHTTPPLHSKPVVYAFSFPECPIILTQLYILILIYSHAVTYYSYTPVQPCNLAIALDKSYLTIKQRELSAVQYHGQLCSIDSESMHRYVDYYYELAIAVATLVSWA